VICKRARKWIPDDPGESSDDSASTPEVRQNELLRWNAVLESMEELKLGRWSLPDDPCSKFFHPFTKRVVIVFEFSVWWV
jgi:hypothetical protein